MNIHNPTYPCSCYVRHGSGQNLDHNAYDIVYCPTHSAAPELLSVCDMITRVVPDSDPIVMFAVVEKARAAIAKATSL